MACFSPRKAWFSAEGGRPSFDEKRGYDMPKVLACGQCIGCRVTRRSSWALRARLELLASGEMASFVTRTYSDEFVPLNGSLDFRDTQLFYKRLRKALAPHRIRYVGAEEYGLQTLRPHCHDLIFGFWPPDARRFGDYFLSEFLERCWGKGHVVIAPVTPETVSYVCSHHVDKLTGAAARIAYSRVDPSSGEIVRLQAPHFYASRNPGIGAPFLDRWAVDITRADLNGICVQGDDVALGRYLDEKIFERWPDLAIARETRKLLDMDSDEFRAANTPEALKARRTNFVARMRISRERRSL